MSKLIRIEDNTYTELDKLRVGRQTFDAIIQELIEQNRRIEGLSGIVRGAGAYRGFQKSREDVVRKATLERRDLDSRTLKE